MIALLIILLTTLYSSLASFLIYRDNINKTSIQNGFYILTILLLLISILIPNSLHISGKNSFYIVTFILLINIIFTISSLNRNFMVNYFKNNTTFFIILSILYIFYLFFDLLELRFHSSPDNHGFAANVGIFSDNFSYNALRINFMKITGLNEAIHIGQKTPLLDSVWNIPDVRLRAAADMIFTVGRIGLPLWGASLSALWSPLNLFPSFMIALGILGAAFLAGNYKQSTKNILLIADENKDLSFSSSFLNLFLLLLITSPFIQIFILEGTLTQLFFLVSVSYLITRFTKLILNLKFNLNNNLEFLNITIVNVFISIIYPNGVLLTGVLTFSMWAILPFYTKKFIYFLAPALAWLVSLTISFLLLGKALPILLMSFLSGVSGVPYGIGVFNFSEFISWWPNTILATNTTGPNTGYINLGSSAPNIFNTTLIFDISVVLIYIINSILIYIKKNKVIFIFLTVYLAIFLYPVISMLIKPNSFHPYIFARNNANFIVICGPLIVAQVIYIVMQLKSNIFKLICITLLFTILILSNISFSHFLKDFYKHSEAFVIKNSNEFNSFDSTNTLFISDIPDHRVISLTLLGPLFYLSDNWEPKFYPEDFKQPVGIVLISRDNNIFKFKKIGELMFTSPLRGPINLDQIYEHPGFIMGN